MKKTSLLHFREKDIERIALLLLLGSIAFTLLVKIEVNFLITGPLQFGKLFGLRSPIMILIMMIYMFGMSFGFVISPFLIAVTLYRKVNWKLQSRFLDVFFVDAVLLILSVASAVSLLPTSLFGELALLKQDFILVLIMVYCAGLERYRQRLREKVTIPPATMRYILIVTFLSYCVVIGKHIVVHAT